MRTQRRLTAVMFTDVVGYSAMVNADEARGRGLLALHDRILRREIARFGGAHVDCTGDGNLVLFESALAAAECAVALQDALRRRNASVTPEEQLRLRIGLHLGDVERTGGRVFGDGINVCARLEPLAPHGGIAASAGVVAQVHGPLRASFASQGMQSLKNIAEPVEVCFVPEDAIAAAAAHVATPGRRPLAFLRAPGPGRAAGAGALVAAAVVLALSGVAALGIALLRAPAAADDASVAVLPLDDLSAPPGNAAFVGGLHDSLLTEISRVPGLRVISRSSVQRYASERPSSPEIGRQLKVAHLVEGSVQRDGGRIRVNVQLIRAATDEHVWAEVYERGVDDLFQIQADISREVSRRIRGRLLLAALPAPQRPTASVDAYDLYLRAIAVEDEDLTMGTRAPDEPLRLLQMAVEIDPNFALAQAAVARLCAWGAQWASWADPARVAEYAQRARTAAERALALDPELPEALLAMGLARSWSERDASVLEPYLRDALARRPAWPIALYLLTGVQEQNAAPDAIATTRALLELEPNSDRAHEQLLRLLLRARRYAEAAAECDDWLAATHRQHLVRHRQAQLQFYRSGDLAPLKDSVARTPPPESGLSQGLLDSDRWIIATYEQRWADAAAIERARADDFVAGRSSEYFWALAAGQALAFAGDPAAQPYLRAVAAYLDGVLAATPDDVGNLIALSQARAALGEGEPALAAARRARSLRQPAGGAHAAPIYHEALLNLGQVSARFGGRDEALAALRELLAAPSGVHAHAVLRDPLWLPLAADREFQSLVRAALPAA